MSSKQKFDILVWVKLHALRSMDVTEESLNFLTLEAFSGWKTISVLDLTFTSFNSGGVDDPSVL